MIATCGQISATTMDQAPGVWNIVARLAHQAQQAAADLMVLPETTYPAYWLESPARYRRSDIERSEAVLARLSRVAAEHSFWLVAGFVEEESGRLFNSAAVFDRAGKHVGTARKNFLWDCDHRWFAAGDTLSVFDTEFGKMGVLICADARVPEIAATLAHDGAELIVQPTAWVNTSKVRRTYRNIQADFLIRARAMECGVPFVCSSKCGREGSVLEYVGQSQIVAADGSVLAKAAIGGDELITAKITPASSRPIQITELLRQRLLSTQPPYRAAQPGGKCTIPLKADVDAITAALTSAGARFTRSNAAELAGFTAARCAALDGAQVLLAEGRLIDDTMARARAAENRVFVIIASDKAYKVIDPDGAIAWREGDWSETLEIDLGLADVKQFTPDTDMWAGRRVASYRLGGRVGPRGQ
jgi:predicted amidohydrolase